MKYLNYCLHWPFIRGEGYIQLEIKLWLLTAVRLGELRYAEPAHFDLDKGLWLKHVKQLQKHARDLPLRAILRLFPYI